MAERGRSGNGEPNALFVRHRVGDLREVISPSASRLPGEETGQDAAPTNDGFSRNQEKRGPSPVTPTPRTTSRPWLTFARRAEYQLG
jgi:hypothetical protein